MRRPCRRGEIWKDIPGFEAMYEVSNRGRVWSVPRLDRRRVQHGGKLLVQTVAGSGAYYTVHLWRDGKGYTCAVHVLVCLAFEGACPPGQMVRHGAEGPLVNWWPENLRYGTPAQNMADQYRDGTRARGERHGSSKLDADKVRDIRARAAEGETNTALAAEYGVDRMSISKVVRRITWAHVA